MASNQSFLPGEITAAILAGGEGRRLGGRDKGLELLAGRPLIAHVISALAGQAGRCLVCANRNVEKYAAFATPCADRRGGFHGPLAGIDAALAVCTSPWLLTVPVDCPRPPEDLARRLHQAACRADAAAAVGACRRPRQPLFAIYRCELANSAGLALAQDSSVWRWQDQCGTAQADFSDAPLAFVNLNTEDDFRSWEESNRV